MAKLKQFSDDEVQCSNCEVIFTVVWQRRIDIYGIEWCPFCGDDIEGADEGGSSRE